MSSISRASVSAATQAAAAVSSPSIHHANGQGGDSLVHIDDEFVATPTQHIIYDDDDELSLTDEFVDTDEEWGAVIEPHHGAGMRAGPGINAAAGGVYSKVASTDFSITAAAAATSTTASSTDVAADGQHTSSSSMTRCVRCGPTACLIFSSIFYFTAAVSIVMYNRWLLHYHEFDYPLTLVLVSALSNALMSAAFISIFMPHEMQGPNWVTRISTKRILHQILPIGILFCADISFTNAAMVDLSISLVEVVKSGVPMLVLAYRIMAGRESFSMAKLLVVCLLVIGVAMTSLGDVTFGIVGFVMAVAAMITAALRLVMMEVLLSGENKMSPILSLMYIGPITAVSLIIPFLSFEYERLFKSQFVAPENGWYTASLVAGGAGFAFLLNISQLMLLSYSTALTCCVVGVVKFVALIGISSWMFPDTRLTLTNDIGLVAAVLGISLYNYLNIVQLKEKERDNAVDSGVAPGLGALHKAGSNVEREEQSLINGEYDDSPVDAGLDEDARTLHNLTVTMTHALDHHDDINTDEDEEDITTSGSEIDSDDVPLIGSVGGTVPLGSLQPPPT
jgi:Triose-phosphate Transporter family